MKTNPKRSIMAAALCGALMLAASAANATWIYNSSADTLSHDTTPWVLDVSASGTDLTVTRVRTSPARATILPLNDAVSDGCKITAIGYRAFRYCDDLTSVTIGNGVTSIGEDAFLGCDELTSVTIGSGVTSIGDYAFSGCESLRSVTIGNSVTSIGQEAFYMCENLTSLTIGSGVTSIGDAAFEDCIRLTSVTIPNSVRTIGDSAFASCESLRSLTIGSGVTSISADAFNGCYSLTSVTIPNSVRTIGWHAFAECESLRSVTIGSGVTSIGEGAFGYCESLTSVTIPSGVTSIGDAAFFACENLTSISVAAGNPSYRDVNGVLFNSSMTTLIKYPEGKKGAYSIHAGVTSIGNSAFSLCAGLTSVTIPNSVTTIGRYAFSNCERLTSLTIPRSVTSIGNGAFLFCFGLTSVIFDGGYPAYVGVDLFSYAYNPTVYVYSANVASWEPHVGPIASGYATWQSCPVRLATDSPPPPASVTVVFNGSGGTPATQTVPQTLNGRYVLPVDPIRAGYTFAGWWTAASGVTRVTAETVAGQNANHMLYAQWTQNAAPPPPPGPAPDLAPASSSEPGVGVAITIPVTVNGIANPKVSVKGLPAGMKYDAKTGTITGVPTKAGTYTVTVTAQDPQNPANTSTQTITLDVPALPDGASGTFSGYIEGTGKSAAASGSMAGTLTLTVTKTGKVSAKVVTPEGTQSFSAKAWGARAGNTFTAKLANQKGTLDLSVNAAAGGNALGVSGTLTLGGMPYRVAGQKTAACPAASYTVALPVSAVMAEGSAQNASAGDGYLTIDVNAKGVAKLAGMAADGATKLSGSAAMLRVGSGWVIPAVFKVNSGKGYFGGLLAVAADGRIAGTHWHWLNPGKAAGADNYTVALAPFGCLYTAADAARYGGRVFAADAPPAGVWDGAWLHMPRVAILAGGGKLSLPKAQNPALDRNTGAYAFDTAGGNPAVATLAVTAKSGVIKGKFLAYSDLGNGTFSQAPVTYAGVLLPAYIGSGTDIGHGSYLIPWDYGSLKLKQSYRVRITQ